MAVGQSTFITGVDFDDDYEGSEYIGDGNYAWEWYKFQVTVNISVLLRLLPEPPWDKPLLVLALSS